MKIDVLPDVEAVAREAAARIAGAARASVASHGRFVIALSGGQTPWAMLHALTEEDVPWAKLHVVQVDERDVPAGHAERNLTHLLASLLHAGRLPTAQLHAMPVEAPDLEAAAAQYAKTLQQVAGSPPVLDLVHLGLGADGHTASLVPEDPVLDEVDADVAISGLYKGSRRMTLTFPILNRAREILWLVTGDGKADALARLYDGDTSIPAGRIRRDRAFVFADRAAMPHAPQER
jgi:6-phosphogluconolactonase